MRHLEGGGTHDGETRLEHQPRRVAKGLLAVKMGGAGDGQKGRSIKGNLGVSYTIKVVAISHTIITRIIFLRKNKEHPAELLSNLEFQDSEYFAGKTTRAPQAEFEMARNHW